MSKKDWVFIAPHFDDVALSCGGLVWTLAQEGYSVEVWTVFGGFPPDQNFSEFAQKTHAAWGKAGAQAMQMRREEDHQACERLGAFPRHFDWLDAIYRRDPQTGAAYVTNNEELFGKSVEDALVSEIASWMQEKISADTHLVLPIGLGNHVDHRVVALAGDQLNRDVFYYADYPYILWHFDDPRLHDGALIKRSQPLSPDALQAWQDAVLCYASQLSGFWRDEPEARLAIKNYLSGGGGRLWLKAVVLD